jgi:bifunctional pyridoxal-dependent enzyme with beta-cystathionase and maltose regulon repressor activities
LQKLARHLLNLINRTNNNNGIDMQLSQNESNYLASLELETLMMDAKDLQQAMNEEIAILSDKGNYSTRAIKRSSLRLLAYQTALQSQQNSIERYARVRAPLLVH